MGGKFDILSLNCHRGIPGFQRRVALRESCILDPNGASTTRHCSHKIAKSRPREVKVLYALDFVLRFWLYRDCINCRDRHHPIPPIRPVWLQFKTECFSKSCICPPKLCLSVPDLSISVQLTVAQYIKYHESYLKNCLYNGGKIPARDGASFPPITTHSCEYIIRQVCTRGNFIYIGDREQTLWRRSENGVFFRT